MLLCGPVRPPGPEPSSAQAHGLPHRGTEERCGGGRELEGRSGAKRHSGGAFALLSSLHTVAIPNCDTTKQ